MFSQYGYIYDFFFWTNFKESSITAYKKGKNIVHWQNIVVCVASYNQIEQL